MSPTRSGTAVLLCLALAVTMTVLGYLFLRTVLRHQVAAKSEQMIGLARSAAQSGVAHAVEQIMLDYQRFDLPVATAAGSATTAPATYLDGAFRAPFVSMVLPNTLGKTQLSGSGGGDDVQDENPLTMGLQPGSTTTLAYDGSRSAIVGHNMHNWHLGEGVSVFDGRGRYIEVGYHNRTRPDPSSTPQPVAPTRFTDLTAAAPEESNGIFLDNELRRIDSGDPRADRENCRYRLRYAVGVVDLSGELLCNPIADMNTDHADPDNDYRRPDDWLEAAAHAWYNMVATWNQRDWNGANANEAFAAQAEHVFRGRGDSCNVDRNGLSTRIESSGQPQKFQAVTFPMMFRACGSGTHRPGVFQASNGGGRLTYGLYRSNDWSATIQNRCYATPGGGERIHYTFNSNPYNKQKYAGPFTYMQVGPQSSWYNNFYSVLGHLGEPHPSTVDTSRLMHWQMIPSVFGRRIDSSGGQRWYQGAVDTPWNVNVLTAPPQVINMMLLAIMPPHLKTLEYYQDDYFAWTGFTTGTDSNGKPFRTENYGATAAKSVALSPPVRASAPPGRDLMTRWLGAGFSEFPAPTSISPDNGAAIDPDYYQQCGGVLQPNNGENTPYDPRSAGQRYPGPLMRSGPTDPSQIGPVDQVLDNLGDLIEARTLDVGVCTHTGRPFLFLNGSDYVYFTTNANSNNVPPHPDWKVVRRIRKNLYIADYQKSYWWALVKAMSQAVAFARATWVQYPNNVFDPAAGFADPSMRMPVDTLEKLDRIFLRQLGESFDSPGSSTPSPPIIHDTYSVPQTSVTHGQRIRYAYKAQATGECIRSLRSGGKLNIAGLDLYTPTPVPAPSPIPAPAIVRTLAGPLGDARAMVMERMLNDFRMSFLGANPQYSQTFRPLDFDGDGKVMASAYPQTAASQDEIDCRIDRWQPVEASGRGPRPVNWFSATGCFNIGKSHYYRILCRGEVYDSFLAKPVAQQTLEAVWTAGPEAKADALWRPSPVSSPLSLQQLSDSDTASSRMLFQRWHYSEMNTELPRQIR